MFNTNKRIILSEFRLTFNQKTSIEALKSAVFNNFEVQKTGKDEAS